MGSYLISCINIDNLLFKFRISKFVTLFSFINGLTFVLDFSIFLRKLNLL